MRIGIVTSKNAEPLIKSVIEHLDPEIVEKIDIKIITLPIPAISHLDTSTLARLLVLQKDKLKDIDMLLIPGLCRGSAHIIDEATGVTAYKASKDPGLLPEVLRLIHNGERLSKEYPVEDYYSNLQSIQRPTQTAFKIRQLDIPLRGPPLLIAAEIPPLLNEHQSSMLAERYIEEGADIIIVGSSNFESLELFSKRIDIALDTGKPVLCEAGSRKAFRIGLDKGCEGFSLSSDQILGGGISSISELTDKVIIVGDRDLSKLIQAVRILEEHGVKKNIVDPVVGLPMIDFTETFYRYRRASSLGYPMLFSAANVLEELSADTYAVQGLLMTIAAELGASVYLVVESSYKSIHTVAEAREASKLVTKAFLKKTTPRDPFTRLLVIKQENHPPKIRLEESSKGGIVDAPEYLEPEMDKGYFIIYVDHEAGQIIVVYREGSKTIAWRSRGARGLFRTITRSLDISREHAAYLGYELAKAQLALETGRSYIQDKPLFNYPWRVQY